MVKHALMGGQVLHGEALQVLTTLDEHSVDTIVTSPPYFRQRNYDQPDQLGRESSPREYTARLVNILAEARRVLKPTGSLWLVLGDKYDRGQLLGMPWRVAIALQDDGWILRSDIIWAQTQRHALVGQDASDTRS